MRKPVTPRKLGLSTSLDGISIATPQKKVDVVILPDGKLGVENRNFYKNLQPKRESKESFTLKIIWDDYLNQLSPLEAKILICHAHGSVQKGMTHTTSGLSNYGSTQAFFRALDFTRNPDSVRYLLSCGAQQFIEDIKNNPLIVPEGSIIVTNAPDDLSVLNDISLHHAKILTEDYQKNKHIYDSKSKAYIAVSQFAKLIASSPQYIAFNIMVGGEMKTFESQLPKDKAVSTEEEIKRHIGNIQICFGEFLLKHGIMDIRGVNEILPMPLLPKQNIRAEDIDQYKKDTLTIYCDGGFKGEILAAFFDNNAALVNEPLDDKGGTALVCFASEPGDNIKVVEILLEAKADINQPSKSGAKALGWAIKANNLDIVNLLLKRGATVDEGMIGFVAKKEGKMKDIFRGYFVQEAGGIGRVNEFVRAGFDVNSLDSFGQTALMVAVGNGKIENVKMLLAAGARLDIKDNTEKTVFDYIHKDNNEVVKVFNEYFIKAGKTGKLVIINEFIKAGWAESQAGYAAFVETVGRGHVEAACALFQCKIDSCSAEPLKLHGFLQSTISLDGENKISIKEFIRLKLGHSGKIIALLGRAERIMENDLPQLQEVKSTRDDLALGDVKENPVPQRHTLALKIVPSKTYAEQVAEQKAAAQVAEQQKGSCCAVM
jgi:ankyrin repeat protein